MIKEFKEYNTTSSTNNLTLILKLNEFSYISLHIQSFD